SKVNPADAPILTLGLSSRTLPLPQIQNLADTRLAQKLSQIAGVGLVTLSGGQRPAVRVQANPKVLAANGLGLEDVRSAIAGANVIEVVDRIKQQLPQLQAALPAAVDVAMLTDRTITIRASVRDVQIELLFAVGLVVLVIFLFLRNLPATIIPSVAVPVSLIGTFGFMYLAGFSINNLTLMALVVAAGFVVDDAIVVIENIA